MSSFPVPVSPYTSTEERLSATLAMVRLISSILLFWVTISSSVHLASVPERRLGVGRAAGAVRSPS